MAVSIPGMIYETSQRNSVITGGSEGPLKPTALSKDSGDLGGQVRKVGQETDKSESIPALTIPKDLPTATRGRFQQNAGAVGAAEKELWGQMGGLSHFHEKIESRATQVTVVKQGNEDTRPKL